MSEFHRPVLVESLCSALLTPLERAGDRLTTVVDLTCGGGGHAAELISRGKPQRYLAFDRDLAALAFARERLQPIAQAVACELELIHAPFSTAASTLEARGYRADVVLADLGVSSHQLDEGSRGFSFRVDAPLDMRMDPTQGEPASGLLARVRVDELTRILRDYGDEPDANRIAQALVKTKPQTTLALAGIVEMAMSDVQKRKIGRRVHWATKTFQALRIAVNGEIDELQTMLLAIPARLQQHGRLGVITFHSLEDRVVKQAFRQLTRTESLPDDLPIVASDLPRADFAFPARLRKPVEPNEGELAANPRARSARLRVIERTAP